MKPAPKPFSTGLRSHWLRSFVLRETAICLFLMVLISAVYWQVHLFDFISFDDYMYVRDNPYVRHGLTPEGVRWAFTSLYAANWHPITWISHMVDVSISGMNPGRHHAANVVFHILNTLLLYYCLRKMTGSIWKSFVVAMLFGLHPLHVESVAWVSERKDVLSTFFWMLTMIAYSWYVRCRTAPRFLAVVLCFALGLMAKPMLVTLPFVLILLDFWPLKRFNITSPVRFYHGKDLPMDVTGAHDKKKSVQRESPGKGGVFLLIAEKIPLFLLAGAASIITIIAQKNSGAMSNLAIIPLHIRIEGAFISYISYLAKMMWPVHLAIFYPFPKIFSLPLVMISGVILLSITFLAVKHMKGRPYLIVGWLWYVITLTPVIGVVQVGSQSMADRYTYVPLIGIFIIFAWGLPQVLAKVNGGKYLLASLTFTVALLLTWSAWVQAGYWKDNITLFRHALEVTKDNYVAHNSLGVALCNAGEFDEGMKHFKEAIRTNPEDVKARTNLGAVLVKKGLYKESIGHFRYALQIDPNFADAHYNLGIALSSLGEVDDAIKEYQAVLGLDPHHPGASINIEIERGKQRKINDVILHLKESLENDPNNSITQYKLAELYQSKGETKEAIKWYENALSINPKTPKALQTLAVLYAKNSDFNKSLVVLKKMLEMNPENPDISYNIACIYAQQNNVDEALIWLLRSLEKGFRNRDLLMTDPDLENVRKTQRYSQMILNKIK